MSLKDCKLHPSPLSLPLFPSQHPPAKAVPLICNSKPADFPSSAAFDAMNAAFSDDAQRKAAIKSGNAIFAFTLKNQNGAQESWHVDLKETGKVGKGTAPDGKKANGKLSLSTSELENTNDNDEEERKEEGAAWCLGSGANGVHSYASTQ